MDLTPSLEAKFGARSGQVHQIRGKTWEILLPQDTKVGKNPNFGVKSQIQRAKFGVFVTYIFGSKIWGPYKNFRGKFWGQGPRPLNMEVPPLGEYVTDSGLPQCQSRCQSLKFLDFTVHLHKIVSHAVNHALT